MQPVEWRNKKKYTLTQAAEITGLSRGHLCNLENGKRKPSAAVAELYRKLSGGKVRLQDFPAMANQ
jgi:transcriptional regulator with XRE-family HTH domain